jgi:phytoene synthase
VLARACDLGVAMQLTNIARDVGEDARNGRVYLPTTWLEEAGQSRESLLRDATFDERLGQVVARLLQRAGELYARADAGIAELPRDCQRAILAARHIYAAIGGVVKDNGFDSVSQRAVVSSARKLWLVGSTWWARPASSAGLLALPPLAETKFLIRQA